MIFCILKKLFLFFIFLIFSQNTFADQKNDFYLTDFQNKPLDKINFLLDENFCFTDSFKKLLEFMDIDYEKGMKAVLDETQKKFLRKTKPVLEFF